MRRVLVAALVAGCAGGLVFFAVQIVKLLPLIQVAEVYENRNASPKSDEEQHSHAALEWEPTGRTERAAYTALADVIVGIGYALLLVGAFALSGTPVDVPRGLAWGAVGYGVFSLTPALGLPPELPGTHSADLLARQEWWIGAVIAGAAGAALLAFSRYALLKLLGLGILALPHLIGAPQPREIGGPVPPEIAAEFTAASLATGALFWLVLGAVGGGIYARLGRREAPLASSR